MKIKLILIARNELKNILLIHETMASVCAAYNIDWIYIDGNSTDGTVEYFKIKNIPYLNQIYPGRGGAIRSAFDLIDADSFIIFSPDGNENIMDLPKFIEGLNSGADLVIASRMMFGAFNEEDLRLIKLRKWANNAFNFLANFFFNRGAYITDSINGFRAITHNALKVISISSFDYTIEYQMTIRAMRNNLNIIEFPTIEGQRIFGKTGAPSIHTGLLFLKLFFTELRLKFNKI